MPDEKSSSGPEQQDMPEGQIPILQPTPEQLATAQMQQTIINQAIKLTGTETTIAQLQGQLRGVTIELQAVTTELQEAQEQLKRLLGDDDKKEPSKDDKKDGKESK